MQCSGGGYDGGVKIDHHHHPIQSSRDIPALIASFRESGLGLERFARQHRIPPGRLHYWLYQKYRPLGAKPSRNGCGADPVPMFQEVKLDPSAWMANWAAEVSLESKLSIRLSATADPAWIGAVIQALRRPC
jgi:hypothetical protein